MSDRFSLAGQIALVTGSTRGLGLAIARGLAEAGARVAINGRDAAKVAEIAAAIPGAIPCAFDLNDHGALGAALERLGPIDVLVNNAALRDRRPFLEITAGDLRRLLETNLVAAHELARAVAPGMIARGRGRMIFITSMVGPQSFQGDPAYMASKGGLTALMRALAVELGPKGITANAIAPGFFATDVNAAFFAQPRVVELSRRIPLSRFGAPDDLVGAAVFLASSASNYVNGQVLTIDAGLSISL